MVDIRPFKAIRYTKKAGDPANLITQPYDKIDAGMQKKYYEKSPYNYCRLILPLEENKYDIAQQRIQQWLKEGILAKESQPTIFISRQEFTLNGKNFSRTGLIAAMRLHPYNENIVFPHEITYKAPKADRLNMMRTVQKDLEPVFLIYSDPENKTVNFFVEVAKTEPIVQVTDSLPVKHTVWKVTKPQKISQLQSYLSDKAMVITDGHHRYESALAYRDEMRQKSQWTEDSAFNFHMCYLVPIQEKGLCVLPTHRLLTEFKLTNEILKSLTQFFDVSELNPTMNAVQTFLDNNIKNHAFCVYDGSKAYGLLLKDEKAISHLLDADCQEASFLDVVILRDVIFKNVLKLGELKLDENIIYAGSTSDAFEKIASGEAKLAFIVNPITPSMVWKIAQKHCRLPEKSTNFYPKLVSGLIMMDIPPNERL